MTIKSNRISNIDHSDRAAQKLDDFFRSRIHDQWSECFSIAVSDSQTELYEHYSGQTAANLTGLVRPVGKGTRFNIGSVTKPFTASLVIKLLEWGELTLADTVRRFIPEYPLEQVTIFHLLTHSAGYGDTVLPPGVKYSSAREYLQALYAIDKLKHAPNEKSSYFSPGYTILMDIIERITGLTIEEFARETLFDPLGMHDTTFEIGQIRHGDVVFPVGTDGSARLDLADAFVAADSGLYSNPTDIMKFGRLFLNRGAVGGNVVFHERTVEMMLREYSGGLFRKTPVFWIKANRDIYGCFGDMHSEQAVGHTGFSGCILWVDPVFDRTAAILTNSCSLHTDWKRYARMNNVLLTL